MNPNQSQGTLPAQRPDPVASRTDEFAGGAQGGGAVHSVQQDVPGNFQSTSVLTPYASPNGQTQNDLQRSVMLNAYRI